jgi:hypothetical protein
MGGTRIVIVSFAVAAAGCDLMTDAATRLGRDVEHGAAALRRSGQAQLELVHQPKARPEGCDGPYEVTFQESLHHPSSGGALLIGCIGTSNYKSLGYSYSTTSHLNAVRVPAELRIERPAGAPLTIILRSNGGTIDVVGAR